MRPETEEATNAGLVIIRLRKMQSAHGVLRQSWWDRSIRSKRKRRKSHWQSFSVPIAAPYGNTGEHFRMKPPARYVQKVIPRMKETSLKKEALSALPVGLRTRS